MTAQTTTTAAEATTTTTPRAGTLRGFAFDLIASGYEADEAAAAMDGVFGTATAKHRQIARWVRAHLLAAR